jgi:P-type conjugative transfer protein TrbG
MLRHRLIVLLVVPTVGLATACVQRRPLVPSLAARQEEPTLESNEPPHKDTFLYSTSPEVRDALELYRKTGQAPVIKRDDFVEYPFGHSEPLVTCVPLHACDVELQPGETLTNVALGDAERWMAQPATSGDGGGNIAHVIIKPTDYDLATNVIIFTNRRTYHVALLSPPQTMQPAAWARQVKFYYPQDLVEHIAETTRDLERDRRIEVAKLPSLSASNLDFDYAISGDKPRWRPVRAFDDGTHVYIQMPEAMVTSEAPTLLVGTAEGDALVNYRVKGSFYVVDKLFDEASMITGVGWHQEKVTISYSGKRHS